MPTINIPRGATILVCDANKALFLSNMGDADLPDIRMTETIDADPNPKAAELGSDRPGRLANAPGGSHRSSVEQTNWHERAETDFAIRLVSHLGKLHIEKPLSALIVVAPPAMLGDLRKHWPPPVASAIVTEIAKDLVHAPMHEIERALTGR